MGEFSTTGLHRLVLWVTALHLWILSRGCTRYTRYGQATCIQIQVDTCSRDDVSPIQDTCRRRQGIQVDTTCIRATCIRCKRGIGSPAKTEFWVTEQTQTLSSTIDCRRNNRTREQESVAGNRWFTFQCLFTHADGSRVSIAIIGVCGSVCDSVCLSVCPHQARCRPRCVSSCVSPRQQTQASCPDHTLADHPQSRSQFRQLKARYHHHHHHFIRSKAVRYVNQVNSSISK